MAIKRLYLIFGGVAGVVVAILAGLALSNSLQPAANIISPSNGTSAAPDHPGPSTLGIVGKAIPSAFVQSLQQNHSSYTANPVNLTLTQIQSSPILAQVIKSADASDVNSTFSQATITFPMTASDLDNLTAAVGGPSHFAENANVTQDNVDLSGNVIGKVHRESTEVNIFYKGTYYIIIVHKIALVSGRLQ